MNWDITIGMWIGLVVTVIIGGVCVTAITSSNKHINFNTCLDTYPVETCRDLLLN